MSGIQIAPLLSNGLTPGGLTTTEITNRAWHILSLSGWRVDLADVLKPVRLHS